MLTCVVTAARLALTLPPPSLPQADAPHASRAGWVSQALGNASWALARMGYMEQSYYAAVVHATCLGAMRTAKPQAGWGHGGAPSFRSQYRMRFPSAAPDAPG